MLGHSPSFNPLIHTVGPMLKARVTIPQRLLTGDPLDYGHTEGLQLPEVHLCNKDIFRIKSSFLGVSLLPVSKGKLKYILI